MSCSVSARMSAYLILLSFPQHLVCDTRCLRFTAMEHQEAVSKYVD